MMSAWTTIDLHSAVACCPPQLHVLQATPHKERLAGPPLLHAVSKCCCQLGADLKQMCTIILPAGVAGTHAIPGAVVVVRDLDVLSCTPSVHLQQLCITDSSRRSLMHPAELQYHDCEQGHRKARTKQRSPSIHAPVGTPHEAPVISDAIDRLYASCRLADLHGRCGKTALSSGA